MAGYCAVSFSEAVFVLSDEFPAWTMWQVLAVAGPFAILAGWWLVAVIVGGIIHGIARLFGGVRGFRHTVFALGYALLWPGALGCVTGALMAWATRAPLLDCAVCATGIVHLVVVLWGAYAIVAAIRAWHRFSWPRAIATYLGTLAVSFVASFLFFIAIAMYGRS